MRVLLFGLVEILPVLELLEEERFDSNSEMIEDARELEVVSVSVVEESASVVAEELSSEDLQPKKRILTKKKMKIIWICIFRVPILSPRHEIRIFRILFL